MNLIKTITVGIPVFNEGDNIKKLVRSVLDQRQTGFEIQKIIISSDGSTDNTVKNLSKIKDKRVVVFDNNDRRGIARGLNQIIKASNSDILVTLDGDIKVTKRNFIKKLIEPILEERADLTSSSIKEIYPETHIAKILNTSMRLKDVLFKVFKNGNNVYNCKGLARAYSKNFYTKLNFPVSIGNDMYCYLKAVINNYKFIYVSEAKVFYKLPDNWSDHQKQSERFFVTEKEMEKIYGKEIVQKEIKIPIRTYLIAFVSAIKILINNPGDSILYLLIQLYMRFKPKSEKAKMQTWNMAISSKTTN